MALKVRERSDSTVKKSCHPEPSGGAAKSKDRLFALRLTALACGICGLACAHAQTAEQTETGQTETKQGTRDYVIRLLPLASFPNLPATVAAQLGAMHCMIPQTFEAHHPENIIHGAFERRGSIDWAVLCAHDGSTDLLVFFQNAAQKPFTLATHLNTERMGSETPSNKLGSAWGIAAIPPEGMMHTPGVHQHGPFDHDGIEDDFVERSSTIHYYRSGTWLAIEGNN